MFGEFADRVHVAEILAAIGLDEDGLSHRDRRVAVPREECLAVAPEGDFDELRAGGRGHSATWPMRRNFSRRRRTSRSGLRRRSSSSCATSASLRREAVST